MATLKQMQGEWLGKSIPSGNIACNRVWICRYGERKFFFGAEYSREWGWGIFLIADKNGKSLNDTVRIFYGRTKDDAEDLALETLMA